MRGERLAWLIAAIVVVQIPFELQDTLFGLTNLQWSFVALALAGIPLLIRNRQKLVQDRLVQAATLFVGVQCAAAAYSHEFQTNAFKAAIRFGAGFVLFLVIRNLQDRDRIFRLWGIASAVAAIYALAAYSGFGIPWAFRNGEFYIGQIQRLSGSFEYPNIAAAYYGMSLLVVCWSSFRPFLKWTFTFLLWCALILTFSKGGLAAVTFVLITAEWRRGGRALAIGAAAYALLLPLNPYVYAPRNPIGAEYAIPWNKLEQGPAMHDEIRLRIRNTGSSTWRARGWRSVSVGYRWLDMTTDAFVGVTPLVTALPHDVEPGHTVELPVPFQTPPAAGNYLLALELFRGDFDWFSRMGVRPALATVEIKRAAARRVGETDLSAWYGKREEAGTLTASVSRSELWLAAVRMFLDHPFGVGPDNFRLHYGKYLGAHSWDKKMYSNNLYLEVLTGSGFLGLAAFVLVIAAIQWRAGVGCAVVAMFLLHGFVDVFLMTTPIYFAFWIGLGETAIDQ
jgi:hypothetical protein